MLPTYPAMSDVLQELQSAMRQFAQERDWEQFHSPKNLVMALSIEASELMEHFQWLTEAQSRTLPDERKAQVGTEIADVLLYLLRLCDVLQIDPADAARRKLALNAQKYPVELARGRSDKYTELHGNKPASGKDPA
ncbi:nucleotide pyrophosphohydrolase [[Pseudomonas] boreopolis]|uniref:nucleotide pyrophosphohydrolase n=1 Tax=Xanthomonas boreopolis TaxID=86183 RepID=UPI003DA0F689